MNTFAELAARRVSVRGYRPDPVPEDLLRRVLETARMAPSAANRQPWRIVVARSEARRRAIARAYPRDWLLTAPLILVVAVEPAAAWVRAEDGWNAAECDGAILMTHLILAAAAEGLGTCWISAFSPSKLREALPLPPGCVPYAITPLGYPADAGRPKQRKPLSEIVLDEPL
ncbi:MAG: nitroreductase family protein [Kiritimatiellae bacterium]|nr:nitroreductase family protein [Kiritimatiellia bacterium]